MKTSDSRPATRRRPIPGLAILLATALWLSTPPSHAHADLIFEVTVDTSALVGYSGTYSGPYALAFALTDGSQTGDGNNTVTISNFDYGAGGSGPAAPIVLNDATLPSATAVANFTPDNTLKFLVDTTTNVDAGGVPDNFSFSILYNSPPGSPGPAIPTQDPTGAETFVSVDLTGSSTTPQSYNSDTSAGVNAPPITASVSTVPEPSVATLGAVAVAAGALAQWLRTRSTGRDAVEGGGD